MRLSGSEVMKLRTPGRSGSVEVFRAVKSITVLSLIILTTICLLSSCSRAQQLPANGQPPARREKKILIVYLSRTNNTKAVAEFIQQRVGGTMVALELETPYPADYDATVQQVARENETGYLPPLKTKIDRIEQYDFVFLGFPTWGMRLPPPVKSFLHQYSLKGKTVIPFNTNAGYGEGSSFQTLRELCPQSTVLEGFVTRGGLERDGQYLVIKEARAEEARKEVEGWLRRIKMLQ
jgi:flavodoxin